MSHLIYDVAVSIDGYISGPDDDVSAFPHSGPIVEDYHRRLATYRTVLMGRRTYEFGYAYGLKPGDNPYPLMEAFVASVSVDLPDSSEVGVISGGLEARVAQLKNSRDTPIYLCGGGDLAGCLARAGLIDRLVVKRAPVLLGGGTALFGASGAAPSLRLTSQIDYGGGFMLQSFNIETTAPK